MCRQVSRLNFFLKSTYLICIAFIPLYTHLKFSKEKQTQITVHFWEYKKSFNLILHFAFHSNIGKLDVERGLIQEWCGHWWAVRKMSPSMTSSQASWWAAQQGCDLSWKQSSPAQISQALKPKGNMCSWCLTLSNLLQCPQYVFTWKSFFQEVYVLRLCSNMIQGPQMPLACCLPGNGTRM